MGMSSLKSRQHNKQLGQNLICTPWGGGRGGEGKGGGGGGEREDTFEAYLVRIGEKQF